MRLRINVRYTARSAGAPDPAPHRIECAGEATAQVLCTGETTGAVRFLGRVAGYGGGMEQGTGPGRVLGGRYRVEHALGSGGHGQVWAAYDEVLGRQVAVEALGAADSARAGRLTRAVTRLPTHPNLAPVYDIVQDRGVLWSAMSFVPGPSLADHLAEHGRMPGGQVRDVARALLDALAAMHEHGVVHGQVMPANVRRGEGGRWVLMPGAVLWPEGDATLDEETRPADGADYLAPESLRGAIAGPSGDLFSLGATLYHLLTGQAPFHRGNVMATMEAVLRQDPEPLDRTDPLATDPLTHLVLGMLDKDPARRPTAVQARRALDVAAGVPHPSPAPSAASTGVTVHRRAGGHVLGSTGSLLVFLVLAVALAWPLTRAVVTAGQVSDFFVALLPWLVLAAGLGLLAVQARTALTWRRAGEQAGARPSVRRWSVRSLAPPARWTDEERDRRRAAAELTVNEGLLAVDRRVASASPGAGRGAIDV